MSNLKIALLLIAIIPLALISLVFIIPVLYVDLKISNIEMNDRQNRLGLDFDEGKL